MSHHEYEAENFQVGELTVRIIQDTDAFNPREEYDNVGTMVCWHSRYTLGDEQRSDSPENFFDKLVFDIHPELEEYFGNALWTKYVKEDHYNKNFNEQRYKEQKKAYYEARRELVQKILHKYYVMLPLGLYDHSGITMYVGSQPHWSDPGGWDSGQVGWIYCTMEKAREEWGDKEARERAEKYLKGEVETYDQYLTGDVWGYVVEDEDGNDLDSCWGFFGIEYARQEASDAAQREWDHVVEERRKAEETERHAQEWEPRMMAI